MDTGVLDVFNTKLILDYYFCLKSGPVFLFQMFIIAPLPRVSVFKIDHPIRSLIILVQDKNTSLKLPVGVSPLQFVNLHRNRIYFVIKLHTWFCLSYILKTNITSYCIYQYFMSINSFFNTISVSRYRYIYKLLT